MYNDSHSTERFKQNQDKYETGTRQSEPTSLYLPSQATFNFLCCNTCPQCTYNKYFDKKVTILSSEFRKFDICSQYN